MSAPIIEHIEFSADGRIVAARIDRPVGEPVAWALFAHCFTCESPPHGESFAASRIGGALAVRGIATLRLDFTRPADASDVAAAARFLRERGQAPKLLIGHSLGGAAVLAAAGEIAEAVAVATIAAPADGLAASVHAMRKALLLFHAPLDAVVSVDSAAELFVAALHPKSYVSLDDADHHLTRRADAEYVAAVISAWASRYLGAKPESSLARAPEEPGIVVVAENGLSRYGQTITAGRHLLRADEPASAGGGDTGPGPYDFLLAALGACTSMTLRMYAEHKNLPLDGVTVRLRHSKIHAEDCRDCETKNGRIDRIEREIDLSGDLDEATRTRLLEIADKCPVHKTLRSEVSIETRLKGVLWPREGTRMNSDEQG